MHLGNRGSTTASSSSSKQAATTTADPTEAAETSRPEPEDRKLSELSDTDNERLQWARERFDKVPCVDAGQVEPIRNQRIQTNFLVVQNSQPPVELRKYRIQLGKLTGKKITKGEVIRTLIQKFLHVQRKPHAASWVSDYYSYIISAGRLCNDIPQEETKNYVLTHRPTPHPGDDPYILRTEISFECTIDWGVLAQWMQGNVARIQPNYTPDQHFQMLNIISWKNIQDDNLFLGGRLKNKSYPDPFNKGIRILAGDRPLSVLS